MKATIISIGDELLIGQVIDTNKAWIGKTLSNEGIEIEQVFTISDTEIAIFNALNQAKKTSNLILLTGGLGPTNDDKTKYALAKYFNSELVYNDDAYNNMVNIIKRRVKEVNKQNRSQAYLPEKCKPLINPYGTASAMWFEENDVIFVSMAGVPHEMKYSISEQVLPEIKKRFTLPIIERKTLIVSGYTEAGLAEKIEPWENSLPSNCGLAYLPSPSGIRLRLTVKDVKSKQEALTCLDDLVSKLEKLISDSITSYSDKPAHEILAELLKKKNYTLATAESCTGGGIASRITSLSGASEYFKGSVVAYSNEIKQNLLHVNSKTLTNFGAVSEQTVTEMVHGICKLCNSDVGIAVSGISGPDGGSKEKPVGTIWIAWKIEKEVITKQFYFNKNRSINTDYAISKAISELVLILK